MEATGEPPIKRVCLSKENLSGDSAKLVLRPFKLSQQFPSHTQATPPKLLKLTTVNGKDLGQFKVITGATPSGKTTLVAKSLKKLSPVAPQKYVPKSKIKAPEPDPEPQDPLLKLQTQYTTKAQFLPEAEIKLPPHPKLSSPHLPLILKKKVLIPKLPAKVESPPPPSPPPEVPAKVKKIKNKKSMISDRKGLALSGQEPVHVQESRVFKTYTRVLKKIGPNKELLPCDSPDAKTIVRAELVAGRNGSAIQYVQQTSGGQRPLPPPLNQTKPLGSKDLAQNLSIIEQALSCPNNLHLREMALLALAECKTGYERHLPMSPLPVVRRVSDSETQTEMMGCIVPGEFVVTNNLEEIKRQGVRVEERREEKRREEEQRTLDENGYKKKLDEALKGWKGSGAVERVLEKKRTQLPERMLTWLHRDYQSMKEFDEEGLLGIHQAVAADDLKAVNRMLLAVKIFGKRMKIDVDARSEDQWTALELAIECDASREIVKALLEAGAKPATSTQPHNSAIALASKKSSPHFHMLLDYVNPKFLNAMDLDGYTCLHYLTQTNNLEGARSLLNLGADVNVQDMKSGRTALFIAMEERFKEMTKLLLSFSADTSIQTFAGQSIMLLIDGLKSHSLRAELQEAIR